MGAVSVQRDLPGFLPPGARPARPHAAAQTAGGRARASRSARCPARISAAAAPASTTWWRTRWPWPSSKRRWRPSAATGADVIATANPGCMLQLRAGARLYGRGQRVMHVVEILDEAYSAGLGSQVLGLGAPGMAENPRMAYVPAGQHPAPNTQHPRPRTLQLHRALERVDHLEAQEVAAVARGIEAARQEVLP